MNAKLLILAMCGFTASAQQLFQSGNPFYPARNPFYFEGKVDFDKLGITAPKDTWEYLQRGIHLQDDLGDKTGAIADYRKSIELNGIANETCQIVTAPNPPRDPAPCMFTNRMRLAVLLMHESPEEAVALFREVLRIDPLRLDVNALIGETFEAAAKQAGDETAREEALNEAVKAYQAELSLSPVTKETIALTSDEANNAHVHWALAEIYEERNERDLQAAELDLYLKATRRHSDVYPWRLEIARRKIAGLHAGAAQ